MTKLPLDLVRQMVAMLDGLGIDYVIGGSVAMSFFDEPRSTNDVDIAVVIGPGRGDALIAEAEAALFYVPVASARAAIANHDAFNLVDSENSLKVDLFVLGDDLLDRRQIERRVLMAVPGAPDGIWVTSPEDQVLRKLRWFESGRSDRQWRDIVGLIALVRDAIDVDDLRATAGELGLTELLEEALEAAAEE